MLPDVITFVSLAAVFPVATAAALVANATSARTPTTVSTTPDGGSRFSTRGSSAVRIGWSTLYTHAQQTKLRVLFAHRQIVGGTDLGYDFDDWNRWRYEDGALCRDSHDCSWIDADLHCDEHDLNFTPEHAWFASDSHRIVGACQCSGLTAWSDADLRCETAVGSVIVIAAFILVAVACAAYYTARYALSFPVCEMCLESVCCCDICARRGRGSGVPTSGDEPIGMDRVLY